VRAHVLHGLDQLGHDMRGRAEVGIAHAQIDHVLARRSRLGLHRVHFREDIRRQAFDAVKFLIHDWLTVPGRRLT
jgi:hypothetical protein